MSDLSSQRRRQFIKAAGVAGTAMLAGCSGDGGTDTDEPGGQGTTAGTVTPDPNAEVHFITEESSTAAKRFFNEARTQFTEQTGIPVTVEYTGLGSGMNQRVATLIQTGNAPEVVLTGATGATTWARQGILADLSDQVNTVQERWSDYQDQHRLRIEGTDYLVPLHMNVAAQTYRTDLFDEAGVSPAMTFEEERQMLPTLADSLPDGMSPANFSFNSGLVGHASTEMRTEVNGVDWLGHSGNDPFSGFEITLDQGDNRSQAIEALEHIREISQYSLNYNMGTSTWAPSYYTGKVAIGEYGGFRPLTGAYRESQEIANDSRVKRLAHGPSGQDPTYQTFLEGFTVMDQAEYTDAGRRFVEFMMSGDRIFGMHLNLSPIHNLPALDAVMEDERYRNAEYMQQNNVPDEIFEVAKNQIKPRALPRFQLTETPCPYIGALQGTFALGTMANDVIQGQDPGAAVDEAASTLRTTLQDVQG